MTNEIPNKVVVDLSKGKNDPLRVQTIPFTEEEIAQAEADAIAHAELVAQQQAEAQAKAEAKASAESKLAALGLTPEEVAAIVGA